MNETVAAKDVLKALLMDYVDEHLPDDLPGRYIRQMIAGMGAASESWVRPSVANTPPVSADAPLRVTQSVVLPRIEGNGLVKPSNSRALPKPPADKTDTRTKGEKISAAFAAKRAEKEKRLAEMTGQLMGQEPGSEVVQARVAQIGAVI